MLNLFRRWYERHFSQPGTIEFALVLICAFLIVYYLMWLVGPIVVALCIAYCLEWPLQALQRLTHLGRRVAASIVMILFCSIVILITVLVIPQIVKQGAEFYNSIISFSLEANSTPHQDNVNASATNSMNIERTEQGFDITIPQTTPQQIMNNAGILQSQDFKAESKVHQASDNLPSSPVAIVPANSNMHIELSYEDNNKFKLTVSDFDSRLAQEAYLVTLKLPEPISSMLTIEDIKRVVRQVRIQTTAYLAELMRTKLMPSVVNLFTWAVYLIIVPIFTFLMLYNKEQLTKRAVLFVLPNNQILMRKFWPSLHQQISGYIRGKLLHIIIITIANSVAFKLLDVNYALLLGVGVGLSVVIPYVGAVIIAIPVVLVAIFQFGFSESLLWVLVIYTIIQLLDSNVLTPMLFSKAMNLDAFSILAAILIFGGLWGFWGVFFAIPLATFIKTIVMQWPNKDVREQQKREHLRLIHIQKAEKNKQDHV